ncbi:MAG TPA: hypothetical protein VIB00_00105 [Pyrinomonadaceae bacterium]|jgi:hypothetical protein
MSLKSNSICTLPDGREFIVRPGTHGGYFLHDPRKGVSAAPVYLVDGSGQLLSWGRRTCWTLADLRDTGRSSEPQLHRTIIL